MAYVTIKHGNTVLGELNDGDGLKLNTRGTAIDPSTGEYVGLFIREDIEIDVDYLNLYDWSTNDSPCLCFTANTAGSTISMAVTGTPSLGQNFLTSTNGINWTEFIPGTTTIILSDIGDRVYFKGDNPNGIVLYSSAEGFIASYRFDLSGSVAASGNIMSIIDNGNCTQTTIPSDNCFRALFENCTSLTTTPSLPAINLTNCCYTNMFNGCLSLLRAANLPAETLMLGCYTNMFYNCTLLSIAPELSATTLAERCCASMFSRCLNLVTPPELPATTIADYCYYGMFENCTSLTTPPELPATTLGARCYWNMFSNCTSLTTAPELPATILTDRCYYSMFYNCTSLIVPPILRATTLAERCCASMFSNCTSLTLAPRLPATALATLCYWYMFENCTSLTTTPSLPATVLAESCYKYMFLHCSSLTTPPALPATTLADSCYYHMFEGCTSLIVSDTSGSGYDKAWTIPTSGTFTNTYSQSAMFIGCAQGAGRASSAMSGVQGNAYTYYTQNIPI